MPGAEILSYISNLDGSPNVRSCTNTSNRTRSVQSEAISTSYTRCSFQPMFPDVVSRYQCCS